MSPVVLVLALALLAYLALGAKGRARRGRPFPGPQPLPVLGNALQMPRTKVWERLHEWGQVYGEWPSAIPRSLCVCTSCALTRSFSLLSPVPRNCNRKLQTRIRRRDLLDQPLWDAALDCEHGGGGARAARQEVRAVLEPALAQDHRDVRLISISWLPLTTR